MRFDRGDPRQPRGHALAYFRAGSGGDKVYATYIIVLPLSMDIGKYVPPFLASHLGNLSLSDFSAFAMPPIPEEVNSYEVLQGLAQVRDDDLLEGGTMRPSDLQEMMQAVTDLVRQYAQAWAGRAKPAAPLESSEDEGEGSRDVNEVLYSLMNERDRLADLSRMVGRLRFAVEGNDSRTRDEVCREVEVLGRHLPSNFHIPSLLAAIMDSSARGGQLAQLYLDRCYKLSNRDDAGARALEERIESLDPPA